VVVGLRGVNSPEKTFQIRMETRLRSKLRRARGPEYLKCDPEAECRDGDGDHQLPDGDSHAARTFAQGIGDLLGCQIGFWTSVRSKAYFPKNARKLSRGISTSNTAGTLSAICQACKSASYDDIILALTSFKSDAASMKNQVDALARRRH
jgi:hypothetical protein